MRLQSKKGKYGPLIFIGIIALILFVLFAIPIGIVYFKSKSQCGSGGLLIGSGNEGYYCTYKGVCEDCQNVSQCPDCSPVCESKGKVKREGLCGPTSIDLTNKIKRSPDGGFEIDMGPVNCYCCCDETGDS